MHIPVDAFSGKKQEGAYTGICTRSIYPYMQRVCTRICWYLRVYAGLYMYMLAGAAYLSLAFSRRCGFLQRW